jgi:ABC-type transport system involved in multi-copper enzyme maturation permease subunit
MRGPQPMTAVSFSLERVGWIALNTWREAVRHKLLNFLGLLALAFVIGARWFRDFNFGAPELKFLADCGFGAMAFFGAAVVIAATAQLFFAEIETRTVLTVLAKPVWRAEFVLGKFVGVVAVAAVFCALLTAVLAATVWLREGELMAQFREAFPDGRTVAYGNLALAGFCQWLKLSVLAAFTLLVASFAQTQLFTVVTGFLLLVIGHLQAFAAEATARSGSWAERIVTGGVSSVLPNFQLFALADSLVRAEAPPPGDVARVTVYAAIYIAAACALAIYSFRRREI